MPAPAVIHCVAPSVITPPPPFESRCSDLAVQHVGHGLEAAVRVVGRALGLARRVLDGAHVVEQQERVGEAKVDAGERPAHLEALALEEPGRVDHGHHLAGDALGGARDPREGERVVGVTAACR